MDNELKPSGQDDIPLNEAPAAGTVPAGVTEDMNAAEISAGNAEAETAPEAIRAHVKKKFNWDKLWKVLLWVFAAVVFVSTAAVTLYYVTTAARGEFHADCTDTIMWANASLESGHLYDPDFKYACFLPFGTNCIMLVTLKLFGFTMTAHIAGMSCFFVLFTLFMLLMLREVTQSMPAALIGTAVFLSSTLATKKMREIFWGHTIYYSLGIFFLLIGTFLYFRILSLDLKAKVKRKNNKSSKPQTAAKVLIFLLLCAFMLLTGMDGVTGLTLFTIPFAGGIFAEQFLNSRQKLWSTRTVVTAYRVLVFSIMAVIGIIINELLLGKLVAGYQDANTEFSEMSTWADHVRDLPIAWMKLLGVKNLPDVMFTEDKGICNLIFIAAAIIIAVIPVIATCFYKKYSYNRKGKMLRIWIWIHWAVTAVNLTGFIFGILALADWRIIPMIGTSLILSILFVSWCLTEKAAAARIAFLLMIPVIAGGAISCYDTAMMKSDGYKKNTQYLLADFLKEQGVNKGYSTFWNANSVTLITGGKIKVSDVYANEKGVRRRLYQSSKAWYADDPAQKEYFLLLTNSERNKVSSTDFFTKEKPVRTAETEINGTNYNLFVYDHNIIRPTPEDGKEKTVSDSVKSE